MGLSFLQQGLWKLAFVAFHLDQSPLIQFLKLERSDTVISKALLSLMVWKVWLTSMPYLSICHPGLGDWSSFAQQFYSAALACLSRYSHWIIDAGATALEQYVSSSGVSHTTHTVLRRLAITQINAIWPAPGIVLKNWMTIAYVGLVQKKCPHRALRQSAWEPLNLSCLLHALLLDWFSHIVADLVFEIKEHQYHQEWISVASILLTEMQMLISKVQSADNLNSAWILLSWVLCRAWNGEIAHKAGLRNRQNNVKI